MAGNCNDIPVYCDIFGVSNAGIEIPIAPNLTVQMNGRCAHVRLSSNEKKSYAIRRMRRNCERSAPDLKILYVIDII